MNRYNIKVSAKEWTAVLLVGMYILLSTVSSNAGTITYSYDGAGRLISENYGNNTNTIYTYDANGNILREETGGSALLINASVVNNGTVAPIGTVPVTPGSDTNFLFTANSYFHLSDIKTNSVTIGVAFTTSDLTYDYTWSNITASGTIEGSFQELLATNDVPIWWLAFHRLTNGTWDVVAEADVDGDGHAAWEEYFAGTDPNSIASIFNMVQTVAGVNHEITWYSTAGKFYDVYSATNITNTFTLQASGLPATPPLNTYTNIAVSEDTIFYRIRLQP